MADPRGGWLERGAGALAQGRERAGPGFRGDPRWADRPGGAGHVLRAVLLFHPAFFYPDVRIHAVFARELGKHGIVEFLRSFTANQFRYSLGLQYENGHWYAFPYPPAFYVLCWPLLKWGKLSPEVAVSTLAAVANSLETLLVFALHDG